MRQKLATVVSHYFVLCFSANFTKLLVLKMESPSTTPGWWSFMKETSFDEPKAAPKSLWACTLTHNPSDEEEAAISGEEPVDESVLTDVLSDSFEEIHLEESPVRQIHKRVSWQYPLPTTRMHQGDDEKEKTVTSTSILGLLKESACHYDASSPSYKRFAERVDQKLDTFEKSLFGPIVVGNNNETFDTEDDQPSSCLLSPNHTASSNSSLSMFGDLQEEIGMLRLRNDDTHSLATSRYKQFLKNGSIKTQRRIATDNRKTPLAPMVDMYNTSEEAIEVATEESIEVSTKELMEFATRQYKPGYSEPEVEEEGIEQVFGKDFKPDKIKAEEPAIEQVLGKDFKSQEIKAEKSGKEETTVSQSHTSHFTGPPVTVQLEGRPVTPANASALKNMSSLTDDDLKKRMEKCAETDTEAGVSSKTCTPKFSKKGFSILRKLGRSSETGSTSKMTSESYPTMRMVSKSMSIASVAEQDNVCFIYDYGSSSNAYVAYFRRAHEARRVIRLYEHPTPPVFSTLPGEVVIKIEASTVSSSDCAIRRGEWWGEGSRRELNLPIVPGVAFAGRILQGDKAAERSGFHVGDRVISLVRVGASSRHLCISKDRLVKVPTEIHDPASACCLPEVYLAAFQSLHLGQKNAARYRKTALTGKSILVLGGDTVMGHAAIELGVAAGATIVYGSVKEKHFSAVEQAGGFPLHRDARRWFAMVEGKIDLIIAAENDDYVASNLKYEHVRKLTPNGKLILVTRPDQDETSVVDLDMVDGSSTTTSRKLAHFNVFDSWEANPKQGKRDLAHLLTLLEKGKVKPNIIERIPLSKVAKAQDLMDDKVLRGFVVCEPWVKGKKRGPMLPGDFYSESLNQSLSAGSVSAGSLMYENKTPNPVETKDERDTATEEQPVIEEKLVTEEQPVSEDQPTTTVDETEMAVTVYKFKKPSSVVTTQKPWVIGSTTKHGLVLSGTDLETQSLDQLLETLDAEMSAREADEAATAPAQEATIEEDSMMEKGAHKEPNLAPSVSSHPCIFTGQSSAPTRHRETSPPSPPPPPPPPSDENACYHI